MIETFDDVRLQPLWSRLRSSTVECPFVVAGPAADRVLVKHYDGGRDATYVVVAPRTEPQAVGDFVATIRYAPFVAGTALIYDVTAQTLQGKARPFQCRISGSRGRVFALLPYQLEEIAVKLAGSRAQPVVEVAFLDACGERLQAALPFQWRLVDKRDVALDQGYAATDRRGRAMIEWSAPTGSERAAGLVVRSCLTGQERRVRHP